MPLMLALAPAERLRFTRGECGIAHLPSTKQAAKPCVEVLPSRDPPRPRPECSFRVRILGPESPIRDPSRSRWPRRSRLADADPGRSKEGGVRGGQPPKDRWAGRGAASRRARARACESPRREDVTSDRPQPTPEAGLRGERDDLEPVAAEGLDDLEESVEQPALVEGVERPLAVGEDLERGGRQALPEGDAHQ